MSSKIDFSHGTKTREFVLTLHEVFPIIEHFLVERDWATIVFFLSEKTTSLEGLCEIRTALKKAEDKFKRYYPNFMPPKPKPSARYPFESVLATSVYNIVQVLLHLEELADGFIAALERGKDPTRL